MRRSEGDTEGERERERGGVKRCLKMASERASGRGKWRRRRNSIGVDEPIRRGGGSRDARPSASHRAAPSPRSRFAPHPPLSKLRGCGRKSNKGERQRRERTREGARFEREPTPQAGEWFRPALPFSRSPPPPPPCRVASYPQPFPSLSSNFAGMPAWRAGTEMPAARPPPRQSLRSIFRQERAQSGKGGK